MKRLLLVMLLLVSIVLGNVACGEATVKTVVSYSDSGGCLFKIDRITGSEEAIEAMVWEYKSRRDITILGIVRAQQGGRLKSVEISYTGVP